VRVIGSGNVRPLRLVYKVQPVCPPLAKRFQVAGLVRMAITVGTEGTVVKAHVVSGNPIFYKTALDAVKQWRYEPFLLNGVAVEIETAVTVEFKPD